MMAKKFWLIKSNNELNDQGAVNDFRVLLNDALASLNNLTQYEYLFDINGESNKKGEESRMTLHCTWGDEEFYKSHHEGMFSTGRRFSFTYARVALASIDGSEYSFLNHEIVLLIDIYADGDNVLDDAKTREVLLKFDQNLKTYFSKYQNRYIVGETYEID